MVQKIWYLKPTSVAPRSGIGTFKKNLTVQLKMNPLTTKDEVIKQFAKPINS